MLHLTRIDPARNMARFYRLSLARDLFEGWQLVREWGRIGQAGTLRRQAFPSEAAATAALQVLGAIKLRRGYQPWPGPAHERPFPRTAPVVLQFNLFDSGA